MTIPSNLHKKTLLLFSAIATLSSTTHTDAATSTANLTVSATVLGICTASAALLDFGNYSPADASPLDQSTSVSVTCSNGVTYTVSLNAGSGTGATVAARTMTSGANSLAYGLYTTAGRTTTLGDGTLSTATLSGTGNGAAQPITVYGRIPIAQYAPPGSYSDTVTVTLTY